MRFGSPWAHGTTSIGMTLVFLSATLLLPREGVSQTASSLPARDGPQVVAIPEKSSFLAGALEIITFPTIGYAYAGNWKRGFPSAGVRILGFVQWGEQMDPYGPPPPLGRCSCFSLPAW